MLTECKNMAFTFWTLKWQNTIVMVTNWLRLWTKNALDAETRLHNAYLCTNYFFWSVQGSKVNELVSILQSLTQVHGCTALSVCGKDKDFNF